jgi:hypothetical protein
MRYPLLGVCLVSAACGQSPSAPSSLPHLPFVSGTASQSPSAHSSLPQLPSVSGIASAVAGSDLPFKGAFSATETFAGPLHDLTGEGDATHLGRFTITSSFDVTPSPATGTATWTASNDDQLSTSTAGTVVIAFPTATITETHTITGGTGRFAGASGTLIVDRVLNLQSFASTATVSGSLTLDR